MHLCLLYFCACYDIFFQKLVDRRREKIVKETINVNLIFFFLYKFFFLSRRDYQQSQRENASVYVSLRHTLSRISFLSSGPRHLSLARSSCRLGEGESGGGFRGGITGSLFPSVTLSLSISSLPGVSSRPWPAGWENQGAVPWGGVPASEEREEGVRKVSLKLLQSLGSARSLSRSRARAMLDGVSSNVSCP